MYAQIIERAFCVFNFYEKKKIEKKEIAINKVVT